MPSGHLRVIGISFFICAMYVHMQYRPQYLALSSRPSHCPSAVSQGHDVSSFGDGIRKHRRAIETLSSRCHDRIGRVRQQLNAITRCEQQIKKAEDQIRDMTIESIAAIRRNERQLLKVTTLPLLSCPVKTSCQD